ncbi:heparan-alpha-glucosaminide N-acetyltransferase [Beggiatoa alba]|nr:heparan-alpha-glucosaminide N-acetyltransferase [Beggiatoa alba]
MGTNPLSRFAFLDASRGVAILLMVIYHFSYDLDYFHFVDWDLYNSPYWIHFRSLIVTLFISIAGISLALACRHTLITTAYLRRLSLLIACALLISIVSYLMFQHRYIFFGILHFIAVASILGLLFVRRFWLSLSVGVLCLFVGGWVQHPLFNQPSLQWFGLMTHKPRTEDYVPLLPWFGVFLIGIACGEQLQRLTKTLKRFTQTMQQTGHPLLIWLGKRSLWIYLLHQPLLMGVLWLGMTIKRLFG